MLSSFLQALPLYVSTFAWLLFIHFWVLHQKVLNSFKSVGLRVYQTRETKSNTVFFLHFDYSEPVQVNYICVTKLLIVLTQKIDKIKNEVSCPLYAMLLNEYR